MKKDRPTHEMLVSTMNSLEQKRKLAQQEFKKEIGEFTPKKLVKSAVNSVFHDPDKKRKVLIGGASAIGLVLLKPVLGKKIFSIAKNVIPGVLSFVLKQKL